MLGFPPAEVRKMSLWEFAACVDGWNAAHGGSKPEAPDGEELLEALTNGLK